jgi:sporulation protein YlmC with PRC-barrel domain
MEAAIRFADLYGARVRGRGGARLGRLRELYCRDGEVTHIGVGLRTWAERLTGQGGRRIPWSRVVAIRAGEIIVEDADGSAADQ